MKIFGAVVLGSLVYDTVFVLYPEDGVPGTCIRIAKKAFCVFSHYFINGAIFRKKFIENKTCFYLLYHVFLKDL
jgi:hypothetical protein